MWLLSYYTIIMIQLGINISVFTGFWLILCLKEKYDSRLYI